ncbi:MAG: alkaline phosphatase PhoX [Tepidiformaceae bacterium]
MHIPRKLTLFGGTAALALAAVAVGGAAQDFGSERDQMLEAKSVQQFGIVSGLQSSSSVAVTAAEASANPLSLITVAKGLKVRVVTAGGIAGANIDMMALWPDDTNPTHLIACNEQGADHPGVQRINIATGAVETIVTGTTACDGVRRTAWGTILFSEEAGGGASGGRVYELMNPLGTTGVTLNRATGVFSGGTGATNLTARPALGRLSFEGFALYPNGLIYYGDENRPSSGVAGGAYFKFIPSMPFAAGSPAITNLSQSPFAAGSIYGLRLGKRSGGTDYGQGTQTGFGVWIPIPAAADADLRAAAATFKLTGYYRPEDIDIDGAAAAAGKVRFCGPNTGNESDDQNYGEVICISDGTLVQATLNTAVPEAQFLVIGSPAFAMPDNIAYQPGRGNWLVHEDADTDYPAGQIDNNDVWDCLPDVVDADLLSDGCIRVITENDPSAEWTGGIFDSTGTRFFLSAQHNITGKGVVFEITGWK